MGSVTLLDSSAVVGLLEPLDPLSSSSKREIGAARATGVLAVSVVTVAEVLTGVKRRGQGEEAVRGFFTEAIAEVLPAGLDTADRASDLRAFHRWLRLPDALILATAEAAGADRVITGDRHWLDIEGLGFEIHVLKPT